MNRREPLPERRAAARRTLDLEHGCVDLTHGAGGRSMMDLLDGLFRPAFDNDVLARGGDAAVVPVEAGRIAMTTDSFVVSPLFFPGGDIGSLAIHGTVNDLAMSGAEPLWLTVGFVLEEGLPLADLARIVESMGVAARDAGVCIVTGDTKVVERGKGDGVFVNTAGVGRVPAGLDLSTREPQPGDVVIVSGTLGDHGVAIMSRRAGLEFETTLESDARPLHRLVAALLDAAADGVRVLRDPTRGGLSATLNELAFVSGAGVRLEERAIPVREEVRGACELLGLDPLNVANEGKLVAVVAPEHADAALAAMREHPDGADAAIVGEFVEDPLRLVRMRTTIGGERVVDWLHGEQLPRIC
ncbi:MAG: hydrogenase expression/formation protein HypE [Pseudomonadales bacterium]|jgi:hydrogenase expression/formation protein HypE|nr:hydrogenase expression/formation protein HypE [Pseudomonadales bacterium]